MIPFAPPTDFIPQLTALMQYQREWFKKSFTLPSCPTPDKQPHEPLSYVEAEALRSWNTQADEVIRRYTAYVATEEGMGILTDLDASRQKALPLTNLNHFREFIEQTCHPGISKVRDELHLLRAEYYRDLAARPSDSDYIGSEAAYRKHYAQRIEALDKIQPMLTTRHANHAAAVEMIAQARAAISELAKIPRDQIFKVFDGGRWVGTAEEFDREMYQKRMGTYRYEYA